MAQPLFNLRSTRTDMNTTVRVCAFNDKGQILITRIAPIYGGISHPALPCGMTLGSPPLAAAIGILSRFMMVEGLTISDVYRHLHRVMRPLHIATWMQPDGHVEYVLFVKLTNCELFGDQKSVKFPVDMKATSPHPYMRTWMEVSEIEYITGFHTNVQFKSTIRLAQRMKGYI